MKMIEQKLEILDPYTGGSLSGAGGGNDEAFWHLSKWKKRVAVHELLTPENFIIYYTEELPDLVPGLAQQDVRCPFHSDSDPSMSVNLDEGTWFCHACGVGGGMRDFEMKKLDTESKSEAWRAICARFGVRFLGRQRRALTDEHVYKDDDGHSVSKLRRYEDGSGCWYYSVGGKWKLGRGGRKRIPYNLPDLRKVDVVIITEGERKADILRNMVLFDANKNPVAVTCTGSWNSWKPELVEYFRNKRVLVFRDSDEPGQRYAETVTGSLQHAGIPVDVVEFSRYGNIQFVRTQRHPCSLQVSRVDKDISIQDCLDRRSNPGRYELRKILSSHGAQLVQSLDDCIREQALLHTGKESLVRNVQAGKNTGERDELQAEKSQFDNLRVDLALVLIVRHLFAHLDRRLGCSLVGLLDTLAACKRERSCGAGCLQLDQPFSFGAIVFPVAAFQEAPQFLILRICIQLGIRRKSPGKYQKSPFERSKHGQVVLEVRQLRPLRCIVAVGQTVFLRRQVAQDGVVGHGVPAMAQLRNETDDQFSLNAIHESRHLDAVAERGLVENQRGGKIKLLLKNRRDLQKVSAQVVRKCDWVQICTPDPIAHRLQALRPIGIAKR
jgi:5S rRNA maturation endonuclease (ribonuclease M5)